uniref:SFRICE_013748 n=1 Tax=Spodoptera frugiperda TaxID=7108 RepID=A0A2H1VJM6_SPOFR
MVTVFTFTPTFSSTRNGTPVLDIGDNRYYKNNRSKGPKATWFCNSTEEIKPTFGLSKNGKRVLDVGIFRYYRNNRSKGVRATWFCKRRFHGCRASITIDDETIILYILTRGTVSQRSRWASTGFIGTTVVLISGLCGSAAGTAWAAELPSQPSRTSSSNRNRNHFVFIHLSYLVVQLALTTIEINWGPIIMNTKRGTPLLQVNGQRYNFKRTLQNGARIYWVCNKAPQGCRVSIVTYDDHIIRVKNEHNH